jgi:hypothetical protein
VPPSEQPCHITWRQESPTPAQRAAWERLWARLLGHPGPATTKAPGIAAPEASKNCGPDVVDQAVGAASTPPRDEEIS